MEVKYSKKNKTYFKSSCIALFQEYILSYLGEIELNKKNFHLIKTKFFEIFSHEEFIDIYKKLAKEVATYVYGDPIESCLQVTPTPRVSFGGSHGTSIHTDYWYGHGETAITIWVPILNCISGSTFFADEFNQINFDHDFKDFSVEELADISKEISHPSFEVLPPEGSCYIFNSRVLHGSPLNTTKVTRLSFDFRISKINDKTSAKDLHNYFQFSSEISDYENPSHPFKKKSILKYVSNGYSSNPFLENICINAIAEKYGFNISDQEGEIMRFGNPIFEALLNGYSLSNKYDGIVVFSKEIFNYSILEKIKASNIKVWACLEDEFI